MTSKPGLCLPSHRQKGLVEEEEKAEKEGEEEGKKEGEEEGKKEEGGESGTQSLGWGMRGLQPTHSQDAFTTVRISCIIYGAQCKIKMWASCPKLGKNARMGTAGAHTKCGPLQGPW